ncbi:hypothetical protein CRUP_002842 [Coryphaenoides rupestris]|nr:hypothetical protein CRUP_002842 [Coryphaenoides rupestris]
MGYERDDYGCEVCECSVPKCRPLACTKTCPYGYVRQATLALREQTPLHPRPPFHEVAVTTTPAVTSTQAPRTTEPAETRAPATTVKSVLWLTTATTTTTNEPPIRADTDAPDLGENYPSQTEMAHIYQSAAWILAALLLIIIVFIVAVLLINKKKKWVQMSCYSAPKKTVILKKHVNKNSVVYMEPSKENKFQNVKNDCGVVNFSPDAGSPCGERMTIPRAKLSMANGRAPH